MKIQFPKIEDLIKNIEFGEVRILIQNNKVVMIEEVRKHKPEGEKQK